MKPSPVAILYSTLFLGSKVALGTAAKFTGSQSVSARIKTRPGLTGAAKTGLAQTTASSKPQRPHRANREAILGGSDGCWPSPSLVSEQWFSLLFMVLPGSSGGY